MNSPEIFFECIIQSTFQKLPNWNESSKITKQNHKISITDIITFKMQIKGSIKAHIQNVPFPALLINLSIPYTAKIVFIKRN